MQIRRFTDPDEFWDIAESVVLAEPVLHSVLASVVDTVRRQPGAYVDHEFYAVLRPGRPPFLAHHTPPYPFHLPVPDTDAARALAEFVHQDGVQPAAVGGQLGSVNAFAARWCELTGRRSRVAMRMGLYDLPVEPRLPWPVPGYERLAEPSDDGLVDAWLQAFRRETGVGPVTGGASRLAIDDGRVRLWCDPEPVAMATASVPAGGVTRITYVYTPPEHRGRGYASAVTAAVSASQRALGLHCMLYTDLANPTSNGIYAALGYRQLGETVDIQFPD
jgi:RimJ/RimL family protein N-acetyltransferase